MSQPNEQKEEKKQKEKEFIIIINAKEHIFHDEEISFEQVATLAYGSVSPDPNVAYTVTYKRGLGNKEGSMSKGDVVKVKEGIIFNVTQTNKS